MSNRVRYNGTILNNYCRIINKLIKKITLIKKNNIELFRKIKKSVLYKFDFKRRVRFGKSSHPNI
jgi:hypothetical protein